MTFPNSSYWCPKHTDYLEDCKPKRWPRQWAEESHSGSGTDKRFYTSPGADDEPMYYSMPGSSNRPRGSAYSDRSFSTSKLHSRSRRASSPAGFHGKVYREDRPHRYRHEGPKKDDLYWLEKNPYMPSSEDSRLASSERMHDIGFHDLRMKPKQFELFTDGPDSTICGCDDGLPAIGPVSWSDSRFVRQSKRDTTRRQTMDGIGFM